MIWWQFLITILVAIVGWYMAHYFTARRDQDNKRREHRVQHLLSAFLSFVKASASPERLSEFESELQTAVATIQVFGTPRLNEIVTHWAKTNTGADSLVETLRKELRSELGLPPITGSVTWIRISSPALCELSTATKGANAP